MSRTVCRRRDKKCRRKVGAPQDTPLPNGKYPQGCRNAEENNRPVCNLWAGLRHIFMPINADGARVRT